MTLKCVRKNGSWYLEGYVMGQRVRQSTRLPDTQQYRPLAERERMKIEQQIIEGSYGKSKSSVTYREAADLFISWKRVEGFDTIELQRKLDKLCDYWGPTPLVEITTAAITHFITTEWAHLKPNSIQRYLNDFRAVLTYAKEQVDGFDGVKVPYPSYDDQRDTHFDLQQANDFLDWVADEIPFYLPHYTTLIDTGVRLNEMLGLRRGSFDLTNEVTRVRRKLIRSGKTQTRDIPMTKDIKKLAHEWRSKRPQDVLYLSKEGQPWKTADSASATLNAWLKRGCKEMGLPHEGEEAMRVHDLRHTYAYLTASNGADLGDLQYLMGHKDIWQTMRYRGFIQSRARTYASSIRGV